MDRSRLEGVLERARQHDPTALTDLVDAFAPRVYGLLLRLCGSRDAAEDLTQETFLRVVRTIEEYEHSGKFEAWLFRIAANLARDHARRGKRRGVTAPLEGGARSGEPAVREGGGAGQVGPEAELLRSEATARVLACLANLNEADREILLLRHYSDLSFSEIAALLEIPLGTALARAHRALQRLRADFGEG